MSGEFVRFGWGHSAALALTLLLPWLLTVFVRRHPSACKPVRLTLAVALLALEIAWFLVLLIEFRVPLKWLMPLQLSDASIVLTVLVALLRHQALLDVVFYWGLTAVPLAMLMPDLLDPFPDPFTIMFFVLHGLVVVTLLFLAWSGEVRPRRGSAVRSFVALNLFMLAVLAFNAAFGTNYMYLMEKPSQPSLLDYFGPWPVYILTAEVVAALLFSLIGFSYGLLPQSVTRRASEGH